MSKKSHYDALRHAGIDTNRYLSLHIDKAVIPDGAEVVVQIRDAATGKLRPVQLADVWDGCFAKNSKFYGQVMKDGHIFNPYMHRRFLPAQFRNNIRSAGYYGINEYVRKHYDWNYVARFLRDECGKLAFLQRRDREAYEERYRFFPLETMKSIFIAYAKTITKELDDAVCTEAKVIRRKNRVTHYIITGIGSIQREHVRPMKYRYEKFIDAVKSSRTYAQLADVANGFNFDRANPAFLSSSEFADCFIASGAYYTLKHMVMFEGLKLGKGDAKSDLDYLRALPTQRYMGLYRSLKL